jgi:hypothetical protein
MTICSDRHSKNATSSPACTIQEWDELLLSYWCGDRHYKTSSLEQQATHLDVCPSCRSEVGVDCDSGSISRSNPLSLPRIFYAESNHDREQHQPRWLKL